MRKHTLLLMVLFSLPLLNPASAITIKPGEWAVANVTGTLGKICVSPTESLLLKTINRNVKFKDSNCENYYTNNTAHRVVVQRTCILKGVKSSATVVMTEINENKFHVKAQGQKDKNNHTTFRGGSGVIRFTSNKCS